jgi:predicted flap endonuclease-1-like 5' DNA nuclease
VDDIEGIGERYGRTLADAGIKTTDGLLDTCASAKGRADLAEKTGLSATLLLKWANIADLMRVKGIGSEFSELLEAVGVDTVRELRTRNAENLAAKLAEINAAKKLTRRTPALSEVEAWIDHAKSLDPRMTY